MATLSWDEWDGNGFDEAFAWAAGTWRDEDEALRSIRQLGVDVPREKGIELVYGWVGHVEEEIIYDACNSVGITWADDDVAVAADSIRPVTFAVFFDKD